jgi:hypothetical protein
MLASGASHLVVIGAHRDSTHEAVTSNPGAFGTTPLAVPQISPRLAAWRPTLTGRRCDVAHLAAVVRALAAAVR